MYPDSVAIVGASGDPTKRGYRAIQCLQQDGYAGRIYPVNPRASEILGVQCYRDIESLPETPPLALLCTAAATIPEQLARCGRKGVKGAVVLANGFAEVGPEGTRLEREARAAAAATGIRIVGPNTSGVFNTHARCNLVGFPRLRRGGIGLISQSGNVAVSLVAEAEAHDHLGFSSYVGVGNQADLRFDEYLRFLGDDENTRVAVVYAEGFKDGGRMLEAIRDVARRKPVVIFKAGRTPEGRRAALSHTGALAGDYGLSRDVLVQAGAVVVPYSDQILSIADALARLPAPAGRRIAVLADGGGHATIAADALAELGVPLAVLDAGTRDRLAALLPPSAALGNPIDVAGGTDASPGVLADCAEALLADDGVDALLVVGMFGGYHLRFADALKAAETDTAARLARLLSARGKPIVLHSAYGDHDSEPLDGLRACGIPVLRSLELAAHCTAALVRHGEVRRRPAHAPAARTAPSDAAATIVANVRADGRCNLLEPEARQMLAAWGVPISRGLWVRPDEALTPIAAGLGEGPFAMKLVSRDILHKSEAGGVMLDLDDAGALEAARRTILESARAHRPEAKLDGVLVVPMAPRGVELIIGVVRDPQYGPVLMFGMGGTMVEVINAVEFRSIPLAPADAASMLDSTRVMPFLDGFRGAPAVDRAALIDLILRISAASLAHPEIAEIDLNPVVGYARGYRILDARIVLHPRET